MHLLLSNYVPVTQQLERATYYSSICKLLGHVDYITRGTSKLMLLGKLVQSKTSNSRCSISTDLVCPSCLGGCQSVPELQWLHPEGALSSTVYNPGTLQDTFHCIQCDPAAVNRSFSCPQCYVCCLSALHPAGPASLFSLQAVSLPLVPGFIELYYLCWNTHCRRNLEFKRQDLCR